MRILVIKLSSLGDIAHALPAVRALQTRTGAAVDWVTQPEYGSLVAGVHGVERVILFPRRNFARGFWAFWRELRWERYDAIVDLQGLLKSALVARLARGRRRYGPAWAREGAARFYHEQPAKTAGPRGHATAEMLAVVNLLAPGTEVPELQLDFAENPGDGSPGPHVAFAPFSRWATKNWPVEKFAELGQRMIREMGCRIYVVGGAGDTEAGESLARQIGERCRNLCGKTDLPGLCGLLKGMDLLVGVDSGPLHWADALGVPLVGIYGATDPARTGPWRQRDGVVVKEGLDCRPCHARTCRRGDLACLMDLDVDTVLRATLAKL